MKSRYLAVVINITRVLGRSYQKILGRSTPQGKRKKLLNLRYLQSKNKRYLQTLCHLHAYTVSLVSYQTNVLDIAQSIKIVCSRK